MVVISSQYSFGADKAVQICQAELFDKGTQPKSRHENCKITLLIWISDLHYEWLFWIQTSLLYFLCTRDRFYFCLEVLTF